MQSDLNDRSVYPSAPICDGDIKASTHVWASLWISIMEGLHVVTVF